MTHINNNMVAQIFVPFFAWVFFVFGLAGIAVGVSLVVCGNKMPKLFGLMNRWISTRRGTYGRWFGALLIAGGAFPLFALVKRLYESNFDRLLGSVMQSSVAAWGVEAVWWFLIVGNLAAIMIGALLLFSPATFESLRDRVGRKYATNQPGAAEEKMYLTLDHLIESFPRLAGSVITLGALVVVLQFGMVLFGAPR